MPKDVVSYVFLTNPDRPPSQAKQDLAETPGCYFVAEFVGTFHVFAALEHDTIQELQAASGDYWNAGVRSEFVVLQKPSAVAVPKRGSPIHCAIVRATARDDPFAVLDRLDETFGGRFEADEPDHASFWYAAGIVTGPYDLLIDLGADTHQELMRTIVEDLRGVQGIGKTITAVAFLPGNAIRPGDPSA